MAWWKRAGESLRGAGVSPALGALRGRDARATVCLSLASALLLAGCHGPDKAAIELRKQLQTASDRQAELQRTIEAQKASIHTLESKGNTIATLPDDRLGKLFTVHGIKLNRLTGGADFDPAVAGDEGLKVYVTPFDDEDQALKAAGSFTVEAFDLAAPETRVGSWTFDTDRTRHLWHGDALLYEFVLPCPFDQKPSHKDLVLKIRFTDELTGRAFEVQKTVTIK